MNDKNYRIVIDPGHGGSDPGAVNGNVYEKDFALDVSEYIYDRLGQLGIPVYITRDTDETLNRNERVNRILNAFGNTSDVIVLSNHINAGGGEGAEVVYALRNDDTLAKNILDEIGAAGQKKRSYYQRRLPEDPSKDYYFIHRLTGNTEPVLIEYGFIDNSADLAKLQNNLLDYGEAVVKAVANYTGIPYIAPDGTTLPNENVYTVQKGDSLYNIASRYGITVNELKAANNLTSNILSVGQRLVIPTATTPEITPPGNYTVYTVKRGDTLFNIAKEYGVSVNDIINFNQLTSTGLTIGQQLLIPNATNNNNNSQSPNNNTINYTIKPGDSLWKISRQCNTTIDEIVSLNNLQTTVIQPGTTLLLPATCTIENNDSENNQESNNDTIKYVVTSNDTLYSIARKYGITVNELIAYNDLPSNVLSIGQILLIPNTTGYINYYVQPNDTLYSIARTYNTTVSELRRINNLTSDFLTINQLLLIPS